MLKNGAKYLQAVGWHH